MFSRSPSRFVALCLALSAAPLSAHPDTPELQAEFDRLIAEFPQESELRLRRAEHRLENGAFDAAESDLRQARILAPRDPRILVVYASLALARGQPEVAKQRLAVAFALEPHRADALIVRARASAQLGESDAAHADYSAALAQLEKPGAELYLARAALPIAPALALRGLDEGLARLGPSAPLLKRRGDILTAAGRTAEARESYARALAAIAALPAPLRDAPDNVQLARELARLR